MSDELTGFRRLPRLHDHWARARREQAYYWFLTFENHDSRHQLAARCRTALPFPHFDFVQPSGLHMTLDRIDVENRIAPAGLRAVGARARAALATQSPLRLTTGALGGTAGAIGLTIHPRDDLRRLRMLLREATLTAHPEASVKDGELEPHVTVAYCNTDTPSGPTVTALERLDDLPSTTLQVTYVLMVRLMTRGHRYTWDEIDRVQIGAGQIQWSHH